MTNYIWVTNQKAMIHKYPGANRGVDYLRNEHRHLFKFKTWLEIFGDNRDVEFIEFKEFIDRILHEMKGALGTKSCEMISNYLYEHISESYPGRKIKIEVSEDGENGSLYKYKKEKKLDDGKNKKLTEFM